MARRLVSTMTRMKGGPTLGGSPTRVYVYDDEALTVVSTLYQRATGGGTQPNYLTPNAGKQTTLRSDAASGDTVLNVVSIAGFAIGDMVPIFDGTNIRWRVITALNATGPTMTVDLTLGVAFDSDNTFINRPSMRGHVWFWLDDVRDYFVQPYDVGAAEQMPPLQLPTRVPATALAVQEEGASVGTARSTLNFIGANVLAADDAGNLRTNVTISGLGTDVQVFTGSGTWTKPAGVPKMVEVLMWGAGGGGGGGSGEIGADGRPGGGGGGGGVFVSKLFDAAALGGTESVGIGAAGTAGAGGVGQASGATGGVGGNTTFGAHLTAYGAGGGRGGVQASVGGSGGGGGGSSGAGTSGGASVGVGGAPRHASITTPSNVGGGGGGGGDIAAVGGSSESGGAGGAGGSSTGDGQSGGSSVTGAGAGGSGGGAGNDSSGDNQGGLGGATNQYAAGGGGTRGVGANGGAGTSRSLTGKSGDGGGGGSSNDGGLGWSGGAGGVPGGGGGGGGGGGANGGAGGAGARGEVIVVTYF